MAALVNVGRMTITLPNLTILNLKRMRALTHARALTKLSFLAAFFDSFFSGLSSFFGWLCSSFLSGLSSSFWFCEIE